MKTIVIAYDGTLYTYKWVKTLMWARKEFAAKGYEIQYVNFRAFFPVGNFAKIQLDSILKRKRIDYLFIAFHDYSTQLCKWFKVNMPEFLNNLRNCCDCIVWMDTADSTGTTQFEMLPYVDYYLKKQILKDINLYQYHHYGQRIYLDYYNKKYKIEDPIVDKQYTLLDKQYANKLRVSWNIGLADIWRKGRYVIMNPLSIKRPKVVSSSGNRLMDIFFNGTIKYSNLISFQRKLTCDRLSKDCIRVHPDPVAPMSHKQYIECMRNTKVAISPFGWGEICYRDFESIAYGAMLLKPTVEHMHTYPNLFVANETYIPIDWDLENYDTILSRIDSAEYREIAKNAQNLFLNHISTQWGKEQFVEHVLESIT